jgi:thiamine-phosphate pyrophosphorylase
MAHRVVCYVTDRRSLVPSEARDEAAPLLEKIRAAARAGVDWVQIREKDLSSRNLFALVCASVAAANELADGKGERKTQIYVNDRLDVALAARAAGVHLGGESLPAADVVRWCRAGNAPAEFRIGASCHSAEAAQEAEQSGADYVFFGPVFETPSKKSFGPPQGTERLSRVCGAVRIPVIAIGGVNETNAQECIRAGATGVAAIRLFQGAANAQALGRIVSRLHGSL